MMLLALPAGVLADVFDRVGESPDLFVEQFQVQTWREHQCQHEGRLTAEDEAIEDAAFTHIVGAPRTQHLLPATTRRDSLFGDAGGVPG